MTIHKFIVYIDGANLFYIIKEKHKTFKDLDLDFWEFSKRLIRKGLQMFYTNEKAEFEILKIRYYNAYVLKRNEKDEWLIKKQEIFFNRLKQEKIKVYIFDRSPKSGKIKGDDVAITLDIITDVIKQKYDHILLITRDSDFIPVIERVKEFGKITFLAASTKNITEKLKESTHQFIEISNTILRKSMIRENN